MTTVNVTIPSCFIHWRTTLCGVASWIWAIAQGFNEPLGTLIHDQAFWTKIAVGAIGVLASDGAVVSQQAANKAAALFLGLLLLVPHSAYAQVTVKFTQESSAVNTAVIPNARNLQRIQVDMCNSPLAGAQTLYSQQISLAAPTLPLISAADASIILAGDASRTFWGSMEHYASIGAQLAALALTVKGGNGRWATGLAVGGAVLPGVVTIAQGQVPAPAALLSSLQYPVTLAQGACVTDHMFTALVRGKNWQPYEVVIPATGVVAPPAVSPVTPQIRHSFDFEVAPRRNVILQAELNR